MLRPRAMSRRGSGSGPVVPAPAEVAPVAARIEAGVLEAARVEAAPIESAARVGAEPGRAARVLERAQAAEVALPTGQGRSVGGAEAAQRLVPAPEGVHERVADHHAARDARGRRERAAEEAASAPAAHHAGLRLAAPGTGLRPAGAISLPVAGPGLRLAAPRRSRRALRLRLRPRAPSENARQKAAGLRLAAGALDLGAHLLKLLVEALDRLLLHVDQLRHRVGRVRLAADLVVDEALRLRIARLAGRLLETLEDLRDDLAFLAVHDVFLH